MKEETKCYCGHTTYCDCGTETLEEVSEKYAKIYRCPATNDNEYCRHDIISAINFGAKWQQERIYSEDDMIEFGKFMLLKNHEYKSYQNIFNEWVKQFKNK